jgi:hypothetical protein
MTEKFITWEQDGTDPGWFYAKDIGSVRDKTSYRSDGMVVPRKVAARH